MFGDGITVQNQLGRQVSLPCLPTRIISLVPSQTELLFDLGLRDEIAGITKFCVHPADLTKFVPKVGGTKQLKIDLIHGLKPDLIIANKEENDRASIELLMPYYLVWISDISTLQQALVMINSIGEIVGRRQEAHNLSSVIRQQFAALQPEAQLSSAIYLIWRKPYMAAGKNTFINDMMERCGFRNLLQEDRYPVIDAGQLAEMNPQVILLSSEPYPFRQKHKDELQQILPDAEILLVNGEMFSWYGSRLQYAPGYFKALRTSL